MEKFLVPAVLLVFGWLAVSATRAAGSGAAAAAVLRADAARCAAMMQGDGAALADLLSDALRLVHSDGRVELKPDYVKNMLAGNTAYVGVKTSDVQALDPASGVIVLIGAQEMRKRIGSTWSDVKLRYLSVWRNEAGTWRMFAWQSMRPAGNSAVPGK